MRIPFTSYHIVREDEIVLEETGEQISGKDEIIKALREAKRGRPSYGRRLALRRAMRAAYNLKVIRKCQVKLCQKQMQSTKPNMMPIQ